MPDAVPDLRATSLLFAIALAAACGSSSETSTAPSQIRCTVDARTEAVTFTPAGGSGTVQVATARECPWSARSEAPWVILTTVSGQGDGSFEFRVTANDDPAPRAAAISIQNQQVQVSQSGRPCTYQLSSTQEVVDPTGGERTVQLAASSPQCRWSAVSDAPWIAIASAREGSGSSAIVLRIEPLAGPARMGTVTIAGQMLHVDQVTTTTPAPGCTYAVEPTAAAAPAAGGVTVLSVRTAAGCAWTASSSDAWAAITAGHAGNGSGEARVTIAANTGPPRTASLIVAGLTVTVHQASGCSVTVTPTSVSVGPDTSANVVQVATGAACTWTSSTATPWIALAEGASGGTGSGQTRFSVAPNTGPAREGSLSIGGQIVRVSQASGCRYSISPAAQDVAGTGGSGSVAITTAGGCPWTASSSAEWIALASRAGTGAAQLSFSVAPNPGPARSGTLTVAGQTFTVRQASPCSWSFAPPYHLFDANGGSGAILVLVTGPCTWTTGTDATWIRVTNGATGTGGGLVQFEVAPNPGAGRTGTLTIGGERYEVVQAGR